MASLQDLTVALNSTFTGPVGFNSTVDINSGTIDNVTITGSTLNNMIAVTADQFTGPLTGDVIGEIGDGGANRNPAWFTTINASGSATIGNNLTISGEATLPQVDIGSGPTTGNINNTAIGQTTPAAAAFLDVSGNTITANTGFIGNITGPTGGTVGSSTLNDLQLNGNLTMGSGTQAIFENITVNQAFSPEFIDVGAGASSFGGNVTIGGNLTVSGTSTTLQTETIELADRQIVLNAGYSGVPIQTNYGLLINRGSEAPVSFNWNETTGRWTVADTFQAPNVLGDILGQDENTLLDSNTRTLIGDVTGNADTADAWFTPRNITFATGDVTGTFSIDGSTNVSNIVLTIEPDSVALGTQTTGNYAQDVSVSGNGLSITGSPGEGTQFVVNSDAVSAADPQTLVFRNALGDFSARNITATTFIGNINSQSGTDSLFTTTVGDTLTVTGDSTFNSDVTVAAGQTFSTDTAAITGGTIVRTPIGQGAGNADNIRGNTIVAVTEFQGDLVGNADTATALETARSFSLAGDVFSNSVFFDGTGTVQLNTTISSNSVELGAQTTGNYAQDVSVSGNGLSITGSPGEGTQFVVNSNATSLSQADTIVFRDSSNNFSAGTISADLTGDVTGTLLGNVDTDGVGTSLFNNVTATGTSTLSSVTISGGNIDGTTIGNSVQADADFLDVSGATITATTGFIGNITGPNAGQSGLSTLNDLTLNGDLTIAVGGGISVGGQTVIDPSRNINANTLQLAGALEPNALTVGESTPGVSGDGTIIEGAGGDSSINGTLSVSDTFTANGAARFAEPFITLNYDLPGGSAPVENAGFTVNRGNLGTVQFRWNESTDSWDTGGQAIVTGGVTGALTGTVGASTRASGEFTTIDTDANVGVGGVLTVDGTSTLTGAVNAPGGVTGDLTGQITADDGTSTSTFNNLNIGGDVTITGLLTADNFTLPGTTDAATLNLSNTLSVDGNITGDSNLTIQGVADIGADLVVRGTPRIVGPTIMINTELDDFTAPPTNLQSGITINRGSEADISFVWLEGAGDAGRWSAGSTGQYPLQASIVFADLEGNVTVPNGNTLDVSAGNIVFRNDQISADVIADGGTINDITINTVRSGNALITGGSILNTTIGNATTFSTIFGSTITADTGFVGNLDGDVTGTLLGNVNIGSGTSNFNNVSIGNTATFNGDVTYINSTTTTFDGDVVLNGSINLNDFDVGGNLTVTGTSEFTDRVSFVDEYIDINVDPTSASSGGIRVDRFGDSFVVLQWDNASSRWSVGAQDFEATTFIGTHDGPVNSTAVDIDGGTIDGTVIGGSTPQDITGSTITAINGFLGDLQGDVTSTNVDIDGGDISNTTIGLFGAETGAFTILGATTINATTVNAALQGNVTGNVTGQVSDISNFSTADLAENPANLYFTTTRVDNYLSGGTGVTYNAGEISIGQPVATTDDVIFNDVRVDGDITVIGAIDVPNLTVTGDLTVNGNTTTLNTQTINLEDNIITLSNGYTGNSPSADAGIEINRGGGTEPNAELIWDETLDKWEAKGGAFVSDVGFEGSLTGNVSGNVTSSGTSTFATVDINGGDISNTTIGTNGRSSGNFTQVDVDNAVRASTFSGPGGAAATMIGTVTGTVSSIGNHSTSDLVEGSQLYFTNARVDARLNSTNTTGGTGVSYSNGTISIGQPVGTGDDVIFANVNVTGTLDAGTFNPTDITASGNVQVNSNLTVNGATTLGGTVLIRDDQIVLNSDFSGGSPTADVGFIVNRDSAGSKSFLWTEADSGHWTLGGDTLKAGAFEGNVDGNVTSTGTSTFATVDINGGDIDGVVIGANDARDITAAQIEGTVITATSSFQGTLEGTVNGSVNAGLGDTVDVSSGTLTLANDQISGDKIDGGTISNSSLIGNNTNNTISAYDITVGSGRTLNVSLGTVNFADDQISGNKIDGGTISEASLDGNNAGVSITGYQTVDANTVDSQTAMNAYGTLFVANLASLDGGIDVDGVFTVADTTGNVATTGTLSAGDTTINGTVTATGLATLNAGINVDGAFTVADTTGDVSTTGSITGGVITSNGGFVGNITSNGASVFSGTVDLNGAVVSNASFNLAGDLTGDVTSSGTSSFSVLNVSNLASLDGGIDVDGAFTVANATGNVSTSGTFSAGASTINSSLDVTGLSSLDGGIAVSDGSAGNAFTVAATTGNVNTSGSITGNTITATSGFTGNITSIGTSTFSGTVDLNGATVNNAAFDLTGNVTSSGTSVFSGTVNLNGATVNNAAFDLTGNVTSSGTSVFSGTVDLNGATVNNAAFDLTGDLTGDVTSTGSNSFGSITVSGLATLNGGINVDGAFTVADSTGNVETTGTLGAGNTTVTGTLDVTNLASLDGGIDVDGAFTVANGSGNIATSGSLSAGTTTLTSTLDVTGLASLDGGIAVSDGSTGNAFTVAANTGNVTTIGTIGAGAINGTTITASNEFVGDITGDVTSTGTSTFSDINITGGSISNVTLSLGAGSSVTAANFIGPLVGNVTSSGTSTFSGTVDLDGATVSNASFSLTGNVTGNINSSGTSSFADISVTGGSLNGTTIGGTTPGAITGTTITANNGFSGNITGDVIGDVTGNVVGNVTGTVSSLANHDTDDLAQGTVNRYYADTLVDAHLSGGLGVTYTNGVIAIGQDVSTNADVTFNDVTVNGELQFIGDLSFDNLTVTGNLEVQGSTTTIESESIALADNIIILNSNEDSTPSQSAGIEIERGTGTNVTLTWNESLDKWTVGAEIFEAGTFEGDVTGNVTGNVSAATGTSSFNNITASGTITSNGGFDGDLTGAVTGNVTGTVSSLSNHTTDDLVEGANLYYTTARLESRIGGNLTTSIIPAQDAVYNIGSATEQFADGFFSGTVDAGTLTAQTKSFVIDHPTKPGMKLRYGSLEGPENGVYVRGRLQAGSVIELPDYWTGLVDEDSITVTLTSNRGYQQLYVEDIVNNTVIVGCENREISEIDCFYTVWGERKDVAPFTVEYKDQDEE